MAAPQPSAQAPLVPGAAWVRLPGLVLAWLVALALGACTTITTTRVVPDGETDLSGSPVVTTTAPAPTPPTRAGAAAARGDLVTASDEPEAARRARIRLELASAYFAQGQTATALDEVKRALVADPANAPAYNLRGLIYASLSENALAEESFRRALALRPADADTLHNFGWYLCRQQRYDEARRQFEAALRVPQYREAAKTRLAAGVCEARAGRFEQAEQELLRSYELDAANPATGYTLATVLLRRGDAERARFYLQRVNQAPEQVNAETLWLAARIEHRRGNPAGVEEWGRRLKERYPSSREAAALEQGKFDE